MVSICFIIAQNPPFGKDFHGKTHRRVDKFAILWYSVHIVPSSYLPTTSRRAFKFGFIAELCSAKCRMEKSELRSAQNAELGSGRTGQRKRVINGFPFGDKIFSSEYPTLVYHKIGFCASKRLHSFCTLHSAFCISLSIAQRQTQICSNQVHEKKLAPNLGYFSYTS